MQLRLLQGKYLLVKGEGKDERLRRVRREGRQGERKGKKGLFSKEECIQ